MSKTKNKMKKTSISVILILLVTSLVYGQNSENRNGNRPMTVAEGNNLYCAGYIQTAQVNTTTEIVGGEQEQEKYNYAQGDFVYLNSGSSQGVKIGDEFSIIRPKGRFKTVFSNKGDLGIFVQEIGSLEVVNVKDKAAVAVIKNSCESIYFGDLLQPISRRRSPLTRPARELDRFADSTGKASGRILMARDGQEMITRDQIVYIDLGAEDNVEVGNYLTIYRKLGKGNPINHIQDESIPARNSGYESEVYKGGKFSNVSSRKAGENAKGETVTTNQAKSRRPDNLRKIVGEMVILNVKEKTATAVITKVTQEVHTGDMVEIQ